MYCKGNYLQASLDPGLLLISLIRAYWEFGTQEGRLRVIRKVCELSVMS